MKLTSALFEAYLKCPTKFHLRSTGQVGAGNAYADWVREQNDAYRKEGMQRLVTATGDGVAATTPSAENLKTATWRLAADLPLETETMSSRLHAVERVPSQGRVRPAQFLPIRFTFFNKLTKDDRLLVAFDALVLSEVLGREVSVCSIIHGDDHAALKVKVASLLNTVRKLTGKMSALLAGGSPPDLILNQHCGECEFRDGCRQKGLEKDELSLLSGLSAKERQKLRGKGIFTVAQLSYTFRARRRPKRLRDKMENYNHSLKALAVREKKIHVIGRPKLKIEGTPVYLDVEGLPDRDFYYLIGLRIGNEESAIQHSLWANDVADEKMMWSEFLDILKTVASPFLVHYGSYEKTFFRLMAKRYGGPSEDSPAAKALCSTLNLLSVIFAQIYFPTYSNRLKDIAQCFSSDTPIVTHTGLDAIIWRSEWERTRDEAIKRVLIEYNRRDCEQLRTLCQSILKALVADGPTSSNGSALAEVVHAESLAPNRERWEMFANTQYALPDFKQLIKWAYFDYQRERVFVRTSKHFRSIQPRRRTVRPKRHRINATSCAELQRCPHCTSIYFEKTRPLVQTLTDLRFSGGGVKRWVTKLMRWRYTCTYCQRSFSAERAIAHSRHYGHALLCWCVYLSTFCGLGMNRTCRFMLEVFDIDLPDSKLGGYKHELSLKYASLCQDILNDIIQSPVVHVDETFVDMRGQPAYVWVLTSLDKVYYLYRPSREGDFLKELLADFKGVLVSDFYSAYDSLKCTQQKCLVHFIRDLNEDLLSNPCDLELRSIAHNFGALLRSIISTVDEYGLKKRHLHKYEKPVARFLDSVASVQSSSEPVAKYQKRLQKSGSKMFTFIRHDGVPWNNNNAEHAVKLFAKYRTRVGGAVHRKNIEALLGAGHRL